MNVGDEVRIKCGDHNGRRAKIIEKMDHVPAQYLCRILTGPYAESDLLYTECEIELIESKPDPVNSPSHYQLLPHVEVIDVREALLDKMPASVPARQIDHWSRAWEYLTRMWQKGGREDAEKAQWYLKRLIEDMRSDDLQAEADIEHVKPYEHDFEKVYWDERMDIVARNGNSGEHYSEVEK